MKTGISIYNWQKLFSFLLWIGLLYPSFTVFGQTVTPASGGIGISADDYATDTFTEITGMRIEETAPGQLSSGEIKLRMPSGFRWDTTGSDPTATVTAPKGTQITVTFQSRSETDVVFQLSGNSVGPPPNNPHTISFGNLRVGPSRGSPLASGDIHNVGSSAPGGQTNYGSLSFVPGADAKVRVETAPDESGSLVGAQDLEAGTSLTVYSNILDQFNNFKRNENASWSLVNITGGVTNSDLSSGSGSATLTGNKVGSTNISASYSGLTSVNSGTITVVPSEGTILNIATQPSDTATAGQTFGQQPVIEIHDDYGNIVTDNSFTEITATRNSGAGTLQGTTSLTASNGVVSYSDLSHNIANDIDIIFSADGFPNVTSNSITVNPAAASDLEFKVQPPNGTKNTVLDPAPEIRLVDEFGNHVPQSGVSVTIEKVSGSGNINGTPTENTDANGIAVFGDIKFTQNDTYVIHGTNSGLNPTSNSRDIIIADAGVLAGFIIKAEDGGAIGTQEAGTSFSISIAAVDGQGDTLDGNQGRNNFEDKVFIRSSGNLLAGDDSTATFTNGVLSSHTVNISTAGSITISATDSSDTITSTSDEFTVTPTTANADSSFFTVSKDTLIADGSSQSIITVILEDQYGNKLISGGDNVVVSRSGSGSLSGTTDNSDGTYTATLTSPTSVGSTTITADVNGSTIQNSGANQEIDIVFIPGALSTFLIEDAGGSSGSVSDQTAGVSFDVKITAQDANGNTVTDFDGTGSTVELTSNGTISSGGGTTAEFTNGILSPHAITITSAGQTTIETRKTASTETGTSNTFIVNPGPADPATSTITSARNFLESDGTDNTTITVQLKDEFGNNLTSDGDNITLSTTAGSLSSTSGTTTDGTFSTTLTAGTSTATATITGTVNTQNIDDDAVVEITQINEWEGDAGGSPANATDWTNTENWSLGSLPKTGQVVLIPGGLSNYPTINNDNPADPVLDFLVIESGANVTIDERSMTINEEISGAGSLSGNNSTFTINGTVDLGNFISGSSTVNISGSSSQSIDGDFTAGILNIQNNVSVAGYFEALTSLTIDADQTLTMESGSQLVSIGDITINGSLVGDNSSFRFGGDINGSDISITDTDVELDGTSPQEINGIEQIKSFTIDNSSGVTVNNDLIVTDTLRITNGTLTISSDYSFVSNIKEGNTSNIRILREISGNAGWRMIAPPLQSTYSDFLDSTITQGYTGALESDTLQPSVLYYDETYAGTDNQRWRAPSDASNSLTPGRGLFVYFFGEVSSDDRYNNPLPDTLTIQGAENDGDGTSFTFPVTYTADADTGFNMVGNPFAATIDWDDGNWTKQNMDNIIYVWDPASNDYLTWNGIDGSLGDGLIKPFQAFWVKANGNGTPTLSVDKASKTTGGEFRGKSKKEPASLEFLLETKNLSKTTHITLSEDGQNNKDPRDAFRLLPFDTQSYLELYTTLNNGTQLAINNLARSFGKEISIPLHVNGFKDGEPIDGEYTLSWPRFGDVPDAWTLILEDTKNGQKINLRKNTFYSFDLSQSKQKVLNNTVQNFQLVENSVTMAKAKNNAENRFILHIDPGADGADIPDEYSLGINYPNPFSDGTKIKYNTPVEGHVKLLIFDILGRKVKTILDERRPADFHEVEWNPTQMASGVYICVLRAGGKQFTKKLTYIK